MTRYIDADKAIFELGIEDWEIDCKYFIEEQPTADVVEVVRCKDCIFSVANIEKDPLDATDYLDITCSYFMTDGMTGNDFCSYGKKVE